MRAALGNWAERRKKAAQCRDCLWEAVHLPFDLWSTVELSNTVWFSKVIKTQKQHAPQVFQDAHPWAEDSFIFTSCWIHSFSDLTEETILLEKQKLHSEGTSGIGPSGLIRVFLQVSLHSEKKHYNWRDPDLSSTWLSPLALHYVNECYNGIRHGRKSSIKLSTYI